MSLKSKPSFFTFVFTAIYAMAITLSIIFLISSKALAQGCDNPAGCDPDPVCVDKEVFQCCGCGMAQMAWSNTCFPNDHSGWGACMSSAASSCSSATYCGDGGGGGGGGEGGYLPGEPGYEGGYCTPSCSPRCGQDNGCGGKCSDSQDGRPPDVVIVAPADGVLEVNADGEATIDWQSASQADRYDYQLYPVGTSCSDPNALCDDKSGTSLTFTPVASEYFFRVRGVNTTCGTDNGDWTTVTSFTLNAEISGTLYFDNSATAVLSGNVCTAGALGTIQAGASSVSVSQAGVVQDTANVAADGTYSVFATWWNPGNNVLTLDIGDDEQYICSCPAGCVYSGINSPQADVPFYLMEAREPWFQLIGGSVAAYQESGSAIRDPIPTTCVAPTCDPYMSLRNSAVANSSGYVFTGGGTVDLRYAAGEQQDVVDEDGRNIVGSLDSKAAQQRYQYFYRLYQLPENPQSDFGSGASDAQEPTGTPVNTGKGAYYHGGAFTILDPWTITSGESRVIFVDGDVEIANTIDVESGGFLAILATGDITVDSTVGNVTVTDTTGNVEGMFVADGQIIIETAGTSVGDLKFVGEGSFIGWSGINLQRDFHQLGTTKKQTNNTVPIEVFRYRPDIVLNTPDAMRTPRYQWREVAP